MIVTTLALLRSLGALENEATDDSSTTYTLPTSSANCCQVSCSAFSVLTCLLIAAYFLTLY